MVADGSGVRMSAVVVSVVVVEVVDGGGDRVGSLATFYPMIQHTAMTLGPITTNHCRDSQHETRIRLMQIFSTNGSHCCSSCLTVVFPSIFFVFLFLPSKHATYKESSDSLLFSPHYDSLPIDDRPTDYLYKVSNKIPTPRVFCLIQVRMK